MINIEEFFIKIDASIKDSLKQLSATACGVLLVVDDMERLVGTISDGDIRRAMLAGFDLTSSITKHFNNKPYYFFEDEVSVEKAKKIFMTKRINLIPIVKRDMTIARYLTWNSFLTNDEDVLTRPKRSLTIPLVVMAGGKGTRMAPFTTILPKPLIPIGEKTVLELILEEYYTYGINRVFFTLNYKGEMIKAYFNGIVHPYNITYLWEKEFCGTAASLKLIGSDAPELFFVSNCDIIVKTDYAEVVDFHKSTGSLLTIISSINHTKIPYGVVHFGSGGRVDRIDEKPEYSFTINTGSYLLSKKCLEYIPDSGMFHMTDLIQALLDDDQPVFTYPINENEYTDIGQWGEYQKAIIQMRLS